MSIVDYTKDVAGKESQSYRFIAQTISEFNMIINYAIACYLRRAMLRIIQKLIVVRRLIIFFKKI